MSTPEEREQFCEENPDHDRCGCQRIIEDYQDHYKEYEKKVNLRDNWWTKELRKYNNAYKNIKEFVPVGKPVYDLFKVGTISPDRIFLSKIRITFVHFSKKWV